MTDHPFGSDEVCGATFADCICCRLPHPLTSAHVCGIDGCDVLWQLRVPGGVQVLRFTWRELLAEHLEAMAKRYPAEVFSDEAKTPDGIAGTALRVVLTNEALKLRREAGECPR